MCFSCFISIEYIDLYEVFKFNFIICDTQTIEFISFGLANRIWTLLFSYIIFFVMQAVIMQHDFKYFQEMK